MKESLKYHIALKNITYCNFKRVGKRGKLSANLEVSCKNTHKMAIFIDRTEHVLCNVIYQQKTVIC